MVFTAGGRPLESNLLNFVEMMNSIFVQMSAYWIITFTEIVSDNNHRYNFGWVYIAFLCLFIVFNLVIIAHKTVSEIRIAIRIRNRAILMVKLMKKWMAFFFSKRKV